MKARQRCLVFFVLPVSLVLSACGGDDDVQTPDTGPPSQDLKLPVDAPPPKPDKGREDGQGEWFSIKGTIDFDPKIGCQPANAAADCKGTLVWGIWTKPLSDPDPGEPLFLFAVPDAQKGTSYSGEKIPLAQEMYLGAFIDDNNSVTLEKPLPDKGDPLHLDLDPFSASPGSTVTRDITFWARVP
jgi:hypothetical protein